MTSLSNRLVAEQLLAIAKQLVVSWNPWGRTPPPLPSKSPETELQKRTREAEEKVSRLPEQKSTRDPEQEFLKQKSDVATETRKENSRQAILKEVNKLIDDLIKDPSTVTKSKKTKYNQKIDQKMQLDLDPGSDYSREPLIPKKKKLAQDSLKQELDMAMDQRSLSNPKVKEVVLRNLKSRLSEAKLRLLIAHLEKLNSL